MARHKFGARSRQSVAKRLFGTSRAKGRRWRDAGRHAKTRALQWKTSPQWRIRRKPGPAPARTRFLHLMGHIFRP